MAYPASTLSPESKVSAAWLEQTGADVWEDLRFPASSLNPPGPADGADIIATWGPSSNMLALEFPNGSTKSLWFNVQMPHGWQLGTLLYPHLHVAPNVTNTGNVRWQMSYTWSNIGGTFPTVSAMTAVTQEIATDSQYKHLLINLGTIDGTGKTESSMLCCKVDRLGGNELDTFGAAIHVLEVDIHYRPGGLGRVYTP